MKNKSLKTTSLATLQNILDQTEELQGILDSLQGWVGNTREFGVELIELNETGLFFGDRGVSEFGPIHHQTFIKRFSKEFIENFKQIKLHETNPYTAPICRHSDKLETVYGLWEKPTE